MTARPVENDEATIDIGVGPDSRPPGPCGSGERRFLSVPDGSDAWSGTLANPNAQGTGGPSASLERARDAVRELRKQKLTDVVVMIRKGSYQLDKTLYHRASHSTKCF